MTRTILYTCFLFLLALSCFLETPTGPPPFRESTGRGRRLARPPVRSCHSAGAFSPTFSLELLSGDQIVSEYTPGATHRLRITISASDDPSRYGFQAVALTGDEDTNAGSFTDPGTGIQITTLNGRQYAEHSTPNEENTFELEWTAPESGTGEVRFYSAVVAANSDGGQGGDGSVFLTDPVVLTEGAVSSSRNSDLRIESLALFPNPAGEFLQIKAGVRQPVQYALRIAGITGQTLVERTVRFIPGENLERVALENLPKGVYLLQLTDGNRVTTKRFIKE